MMKKNEWLHRCVARLLTCAAPVVFLAACAAPGPAIDPEAQARVSVPAAPAPGDFPALDSATWKQGAFPSLEALRAMRTGMGKDQVRNLLSWPHFREGLWGVREWNYLFHFRTGQGPEYITCQYMVRFNGDALTEGMYWKDPRCTAYVDAPQAKAASKAPAAHAARRIALNADGLFRFDGASQADLLPEGERRISALADEIRRNFKVLHQVLVTGHTDRLGSDAYNERLSLERANAVRAMLAREGIEAARIRIAGMGKRQPITTDCLGTRVTPELVACLQPDRRVEVEVAGEQ